MYACPECKQRLIPVQDRLTRNLIVIIQTFMILVVYGASESYFDGGTCAFLLIVLIVGWLALAEEIRGYKPDNSTGGPQFSLMFLVIATLFLGGFIGYLYIHSGLPLLAAFLVLQLYRCLKSETV